MTPLQGIFGSTPGDGDTPDQRQKRSDATPADSLHLPIAALWDHCRAIGIHAGLKGDDPCAFEGDKMSKAWRGSQLPCTTMHSMERFMLSADVRAGEPLSGSRANFHPGD